MDKMLYTIEELGEATGITPRTIRYYTTENLLPPPETRGRYALYADEHLKRLHLIVRLKQAFLPLGAIKDKMERLTYEEVQELIGAVEGYETGEPETAPRFTLPSTQASDVPESHRDFVARVLANRFTLNSLRRSVAPSTSSTPSEGKAEENNETPKRSRHEGPGVAWRRISLMSGVELHVTEEAAEASQSFIKKVTNSAKRYGG